MTDPRRSIPSVDRLLDAAPFRALLAERPRERVAAALRAELDALRARLDGDGGDAPSGAAWYADRVAARLARQERPSLRPVINATGVVLHTNLGRAPLAAAAVEATARVAASYSNLEYDLDGGVRGSRYDHCVALLRELTGAGGALVVNNNAGALVLALNTLAAERDAVISRGELVEIGGHFRIPEVMARSGCRMVEVGATNRTHLRDYAAVITDETGTVLKVHRSNFAMTGFTTETTVPELASLARERGVPLLHDLGSGLLHDLSDLGLTGEPTAEEALEAGADVVTMSGDKLLGGPQAGLIVGDAALVERMRRNPLCRALRVDKLTLAALEATLALYVDPARARAEVPVLRMLALTGEALARRAERLRDRLAAAGVAAETVPGVSAVGGGAFPEAALSTTLVAVAGPAETLHDRLRRAEPAVVARIRDDRLVLDPRTVAESEEEALVAAVVAAADAG